MNKLCMNAFVRLRSAFMSKDAACTRLDTRHVYLSVYPEMTLYKVFRVVLISVA